MIRYRSDWAATHNFDNDRVNLKNAISFINALQSHEFGTLIETHNQHVNAGTNPDDDPTIQTERTLQSDLETVKNWLRTLKDNGQQTISTNKVHAQIETETGYELNLY